MGNATKLEPEGKGNRPDASRTRRLFCEVRRTGEGPGTVERVGATMSGETRGITQTHAGNLWIVFDFHVLGNEPECRGAWGPNSIHTNEMGGFCALSPSVRGILASRVSRQLIARR